VHDCATNDDVKPRDISKLSSLKLVTLEWRRCRYTRDLLELISPALSVFRTSNWEFAQDFMTRTAQCHIEELEVSLVEDLVVLRKFLEKTPSITKLKISHITSMHATSRLITVVVTAAPFYRLPIIIDPRLCMFPSIEENCPLRNSLYWTLLEDRFPASDDSRRYCDNDEIDCCHPHIGYTSSHLFRCSNGLFPPLGEASSGFYAPELCPSVSRRPWI